MPSIFRKNTTGWVEILSVFRKNTTGWVEILNAYRKNTTAWVKVFARNQIPGIISFPKVRNSSGDDINNTTVIARVGDTLTGYRGSWSNSPTVYEDRWYFNQYAGGGNYGPFSPAQTNTTLSTTLSHDGYYVVYQVRATNASGSSEYVTSSNEARVVKYSPVSLLPYTLSGSPVVGGTLTAQPQSGSWKSTTSISGDTSPDSYEYEWSYSDGTILQFNSSNSYLIDSDDLGKIIRVRVTGTNTGGSATSGYTSSGTVATPYSFSFGKILYVGSNGYITLDQAPSSAIAALPAGNGRTVNIWNSDLVNYRIQEYSDSSNYHLYFRAYMYQNPLVRSSITALDYQIKFYTGQPYCDVYLVRKGSSVPAYINNPGYYSNGLFGTSGFSGTFVAGSVLRVYFDGTTPASTSAASWTAIPDSVWKSISTSDIDDSYVAVTTSANQGAVIPTITMGANSGISQTEGTINWTSTNQASFSSTGTFSGTGTTGTSISKTGLTAGTNYTGTVTVTSSTGDTASANYSLTTTALVQYTITWNANGGDAVSPSSTTVTAGSSVTTPTPTRTGYTFSNWRNPVSGDLMYTYGAGITFTPTESFTLYAIWTVNTYAVTYSGNGNTGGTAPSSQTKTHGTDLTLRTNSGSLTKSGSTFAGWNTQADGTGTDYAVSGTYSTNAALDLYAKWTVNPPSTPTVDSCIQRTGGRTGSSPNFTWPNPKAQFIFSCTNATTADVQIQYSANGVSGWLDSNVVQNVPIVSNTATVGTGQPGTNIGNYYYRATCKPYNGTTAGTQKLTATTQNTQTAKNQAIAIS
jgi:uncharacterized repeat protein (TIGR02543 family)